MPRQHPSTKRNTPKKNIAQPISFNPFVFSLKTKTEGATGNSISTCATALTIAACCRVMAMNQPNDAVAPTKPVARDAFQTRSMLPNSSRCRIAIQIPMARVWVNMATDRVKPACRITSGAGMLSASDREAAR